MSGKERKKAGPAYSSEDIEILKQQPGVIEVTPNVLIFDLKFKQELYDVWIRNPCTATIRKFFKKKGADMKVISNALVGRFQRNFQSYGRPQFQALPLFDKRDGDGVPHKTAEELVEEGVLEKWKRGYRITSAFNALIRNAYLAAYPMKTVEDVIRESGYNPLDIGDTRVNYLHKSLEGSRSIGNEELEKKKAAVEIVVKRDEAKHDVQSAASQSPAVDIVAEMDSADGQGGQENVAVSSKYAGPLMWTNQKIGETPYVCSPMSGSVGLTEKFYNDAIYFKSLSVPEILEIYRIPLAAVPVTMYSTLKKTLEEWKPTDEPASFELPVAINRFVAMQRILDIELTEISEKFKQMSPPEKKKLCEVIDGLPRDPVGKYSTQALRDKIGISQTLYYKYLRQERYGMKKADKAASDIEAVRQVFDYKGFSKGSRQIYMLMPRIVGRKMGLKKIRRIMQENDMASDIRGANIQKQVMRKYLQENRKPNLLERKFRLYRPNQVRLTDVTYLEYGPRKKRAYGSASIDPVTGKLIAFVVMDKNDQRLADATLQEMDNYPCEFGGKLHSDQGSLYLTPDFQAKVAERGMDQSMSRRGNCWDNSPQESFFGHFKDECNYTACVSLNELRELIEEYKYYYNFERRMWNHLQMTPVEYEAYLDALSDEEFQKYIDQGETEYKEMQAHSIERAKARIRDLGAEDSVEDIEEGEKSNE